MEPADQGKVRKTWHPSGHLDMMRGKRAVDVADWIEAEIAGRRMEGAE